MQHEKSNYDSDGLPWTMGARRDRGEGGGRLGKKRRGDILLYWHGT